MLLRHIRYLIAIEDQGSFTRASEALHVSQPTLSQQIKQLEESLGVQLFDRTSRSVKPTDAGRVYIQYARRALQELEAGKRAIHDVRDLSRGTLRLAHTPTFTSYLIGPVIERFNTAYPGIFVSVQEMALDTIESSLAMDETDLGIAFNTVRSSELTCQNLFDEKLDLVTGADHFLASREKAIIPTDLKTIPLVLLTKSFATRTYVEEYFKKHNISPKISIEVNSISGVVEMIKRGNIATILPTAIVNANPDLRAIPLSPPLPERTVALLSRRGAYQTAASIAFSDLLVRFISENNLL